MNREEIISEKEFEKIVQKQMEISKRKLEKAFEKIDLDENSDWKEKIKTNRGKLSR